MKIFLDIVKTIIAGLVMLSILVLASGCANWEVVECDHHHCDHHHHHRVDYHHYHHYTERQIHYHEHYNKNGVSKSKPLPSKPKRPTNLSGRPLSKGVPSKRVPTRKEPTRKE